MALHLTDKYIWDFWTIKRADQYHIFYLSAPRTPHNPELRHSAAAVGHAVSHDLIHWEVLSDALNPASNGAWDDRAIWTGSVISRHDRYYMFYTSTCHAENGKIQRIGLATSSDLVNWQRHHANPIIEADRLWYEKFGDLEIIDEAWRDPHVAFDEENNLYYALICARINHGPSDGRGAVGLAQSRDCVCQWRVHLYGGPPAGQNIWSLLYIILNR
jgi:beta-fructofuranosidase